MKSVFARAPLRISFAGGGTDIPAFSDIHGGAVVNATLARYAYTRISEGEGQTLCFNAVDLKECREVSSASGLQDLVALPLHREVYKFFLERTGLDFVPLNVTTFCESPVGAGLGASSTVVVSLIKAFSEFFGIQMRTQEIANYAFEIERIRCCMDGGKQDQYAAAFGGFNLLEFSRSGAVEVTPLQLSSELIAQLQASMLLYYMGQSRVSHHVISDQSRAISKSESSVINAMMNIKRQAYRMQGCLVEANMSAMLEIFEENWSNKIKTSAKILTPEIQEIIRAVRDGGASVGKVSGAGGGGFIMFWVPLDKRQAVIEQLSLMGGTVAEYSFSLEGAQAWEAIA